MEIKKNPDEPNSGWAIENDPPVPRHEKTPMHFQRELESAHPACAAWDEPGYIDPDLSHLDLPVGSRYWQGYAKRCGKGRRRPAKRERERAMSPEWVAKVTAGSGHAGAPHSSLDDEEEDPNRLRVVREKERDLISNASTVLWPG